MGEEYRESRRDEIPEILRERLENARRGIQEFPDYVGKGEFIQTISKTGKYALGRKCLLRDSEGNLIDDPGRAVYEIARTLALMGRLYGRDGKDMPALTEQIYWAIANRGMMAMLDSYPEDYADEKPNETHGERKTKLTRKELSDLVMKQINMPRPNDITGRTEKIRTPFKDAFVTFNFGEENGEKIPYEAFLNIGKGGGDLTAIGEGIGRLMSMGLKAGVTPEYMIEQLEGIGGTTQEGVGQKKVISLPDSIAKGIRIILKKEGLLGDFIEDVINEDNPGKLGVSSSYNENEGNNGISGNFCPDCRGALHFEEGCEICHLCGYSKCG